MVQRSFVVAEPFYIILYLNFYKLLAFKTIDFYELLALEQLIFTDTHLT